MYSNVSSTTHYTKDITIHYSVAHNDFILSEAHVLTTEISIQAQGKTHERDLDRTQDDIQKFGNTPKNPTQWRAVPCIKIQCLRPRFETNGQDS